MPFWEAPSGGKSSRVLGDRIEPFSEGYSEGGSSGSGLIRDQMQVDPPAQQPEPLQNEGLSARDQPPARKAVAPAAPSKEEYDRHVIDHAVYRPWCRHCVAGAGRRSKHVRVAGQTHDIPVVSIDYGFLPKNGAESAEESPQPGSSEASHSAPCVRRER